MEKRTFEEIRHLLLLELSKGKKTLNQLAKESGINWKTTDNHITYLIGKGLAEEIFSSPYVRIFEITEKGMDYAKLLKPKSAVSFKKKSKGGNDTIHIKL